MHSGASSDSTVRFGCLTVLNSLKAIIFVNGKSESLGAGRALMAAHKFHSVHKGTTLLLYIDVRLQ